MRLSEIGRALEETIALANTETRLSRNLGRLDALADGIREVCARSPRRSQPGAKDPPLLTLRFG